MTVQYDILFKSFRLIDRLKNVDCVNLPSLFKEYVKFLGYDFKSVSRNKKLYSRLYMKLRRKLIFLHKKGYIELKKIDGLIWILPKKGLIDLIINEVKFAQTLNRMHPLRGEARAILARKKRLSDSDWRDLNLILRDYIFDVSQKCLVFYSPEEFTSQKWLFLPYQHRFLKKRLKKKLKEYDLVWDNASSKFDKGIFVTLTLNPKSYSNLLEASKLSRKLFNKFMFLLSRNLGFRPVYICNFEPQKSGNPHIHLVIFGISEIPIISKSKKDVIRFILRHKDDKEFLEYMRKSLKRLRLSFKDVNDLLGLLDSHFDKIYDKVNHFALTLKLKTWGFGSIHYEYRIKRVNEGWVWASRRAKPRRCKTLNVQNYLKKYLKKTFSFTLNVKENKLILNGSRVAFYFASNKRFYTCSRVLLVKKVEKDKFFVKWVFIGTFYYLDIPDWIVEASGFYVVYDRFKERFKFEPLLTVS